VVGEEVADEIKLADFGRRSVLSLRQNLASRILDLEKAAIYEKYSLKVGEIITGEVYQVWKREVVVFDDDDTELVLPKSEQIPSDFYRKGDAIRAIISKVEMRNNNPVIILSRTAPEFLERLFEQEVPEILDGIITIQKIVRIPGERAKVAVQSYDDRIDPVGACVGMKGSRIYAVVKELRNENIDVINYTTNTSLLIQRALHPAKISSINIDEELKTAAVHLKPSEVSLAIGKGGLNIRLASMLTGYDIDVYREVEEEDVALSDFADEIEEWIIEALKGIGCDTAKSVLELSLEELVRRTDLEEETVREVINILRSEFE
jgi:N utilization substance protein A